MWSEILRLFVNTLTADNKYSPCNVHNFAQQVKRHYLQNKKLFLDFLLHFWSVHEIQNILKKKDEYPCLIISEIMDCERGGYLNV